MGCTWRWVSIRTTLLMFTLHSSVLMSQWVYLMAGHINILFDQFTLRLLTNQSNLVISPSIMGISKASMWHFRLGTLAESMWNDCNQSLWVTCRAWVGLYASHWTTGKWLCPTGMQLRPHACASASANHRLDIKLRCTPIQDTIHFDFRPWLFAGHHHCWHAGRGVNSHYLLKCHMEAIGLAVVVAALLDSLARLHVSWFV